MNRKPIGIWEIASVLAPVKGMKKLATCFYASPISKSINTVVIIISSPVLVKVSDCLPVIKSICTARASDHPEIVQICGFQYQGIWGMNFLFPMRIQYLTLRVNELFRNGGKLLRKNLACS